MNTVKMNEIEYFDDLDQNTLDKVKDILKDAFDDNVGAELFNSEIEELECRRRDGFIPYSHNKGGFRVYGFTSLDYIRGSGTYPASKQATKQINDAIDMSISDLNENIFEDNKELLQANGIKSAGGIGYHILQELSEKSAELYKVFRTYGDRENDSLSDDYSSVMYGLQFMYNGIEKGMHKADLFAFVNVNDAPYHRMGSSVGKEKVIKWRTKRELLQKLKAAANELAGKVL